MALRSVRFQTEHLLDHMFAVFLAHFEFKLKLNF